MKLRRFDVRGEQRRWPAALLLALVFTLIPGGWILPAQPARATGITSDTRRAGVEVFIATIQRGRAGVPHTFGAAVLWQDTAPRSDATFTWDFGDGATGDGASVQHTFAARGVYTVTVALESDEPPELDEEQVTNVTIADSASGIVTMIEDGAETPNPIVRYAAGWNLVSGPAGMRFPQAVGPLYTLTDYGDYRALPAGEGIEEGRAYWAYFATPVQVTLNGAGYSQTDLLGPLNGYLMAGNPAAAFPVRITGAIVAFAWDAVARRYEAVTALQPGQGAMVFPAPFTDLP